MNSSSACGRCPSFLRRVGSVWYRHYKVYVKNLFSNGLPPFLEPIIFLAGIGLGLSKYIVSMNGVPYLVFLATGLLATTAMFTAAFECSYGTFIRMEFDKVYDGILAAPISAFELMLGEVVWAGTKGFFFSLAVLFVLTAFGVLHLGTALLAPFVGLLTGLMFATASLLVTSFVKDINQFAFYFTGFLSPMFFFSGAVFPLDRLPAALQPVAEIFPLTHSIRLIRSLCFWKPDPLVWWDLAFCAAFIAVTGFFAFRRLRKKLIP